MNKNFTFFYKNSWAKHQKKKKLFFEKKSHNAKIPIDGPFRLEDAFLEVETREIAEGIIGEIFKIKKKLHSAKKQERHLVRNRHRTDGRLLGKRTP